MNLITTKQKKPHNKKIKLEQLTKKISDLQIGDKVNYFVSKGFEQVGKVVKFLQKNNLDQELALLELQEKALKFLNKKKRKEEPSSSSSSDNEKTNKGESKLQTIENALNTTLDKIKEIKQKKREANYKKLFPNDTEFDWEKFKATKQNFKDSDLWKKIQNSREELYKKTFPNDTDFDWEKFKNFKKEEKLKNKENKKSDFCKLKQEKKQTLYKEFFPGDTDFDWEKFKLKKKELKQKFKEEKKNDKKDITETLKEDKSTKDEKKNCQEKREAKYKKLFPEDTVFDWEKFKKIKQEKKKSEKNLEEKVDFKKIREEKRQQLYKEFFPQDAEFDWEKFKVYKKETKKDFQNKQKGDSKYECPKMSKFKQLKKELYAQVFPNDTEFDWEKFRNYKKSLKKKCEPNFSSNTEGEEKEVKKDVRKFCKERQEKRKELYKQTFPNNTEFDWEKFRSFKKQKEEQEDIVKEWSNSIKTVYLDGNNMLYTENIIRKVQLKSPHNAEKILAMLSGKFGFRANLNSLTLVYDYTSNIFKKNVEGLELNVCSARPDFKTSDDALVVCSEWKSAHDLLSTLFVTSDRGLKIRLRK